MNDYKSRKDRMSTPKAEITGQNIIIVLVALGTFLWFIAQMAVLFIEYANV